MSNTTFNHSHNRRKTETKRRIPAKRNASIDDMPGLVLHADEILNPSHQIKSHTSLTTDKANESAKANTSKAKTPKVNTFTTNSSKLSLANQHNKATSTRTRVGGTKQIQRKKSIDIQVKSSEPLRIISLGGLNEIGKNMTVFECGNDAIIVDCGIAFPDDELLGIDLVIPDYTYAIKIADKIRGIFLTHGHEDHIGGLPFFLQRLNVPLYGTKLTLGLVEGKLSEYGLLAKAKLNIVKPGDSVDLGCFSTEIIHSNHSIPDAVMLAIRCPAGLIVHTGDFKIDTTPIMDGMLDLGRLGELGKEGVLLLMSDSTNSERPGFAASERIVGESFHNLFLKAENKRIIIATFSSNIHRIQQIFDLAHRFSRKVAISGRSMVNVIKKAIELGYLTTPDNLLIDLDCVKNYSKEQLVIITTGSQGEPMSALYRMAFSDHRQVVVGPDDCIIISATPIPGNEKLVGRVVNELIKLHTTVFYESLYDVHVSGHACQEEQKIIIGITKPKYFMPVHGEYKHLVRHSQTAKLMGYSEKDIIISDIGKVLEISDNGFKFTGSVPSGRVFIDGSGVGDVGNIVLRDRKHLGEDGIITVVATVTSDEPRMLISGPDIVSRGFVYVRESEELIDGARRVAQATIEYELNEGRIDWNKLRNNVRDELSDYIFAKTKRKPMILPIIMEA